MSSKLFFVARAGGLRIVSLKPEITYFPFLIV